MKSILEHYILKIEEMIYEDTQVWQGKNTICNARMGLPCNCLTGLTINYLGYMITNCWRVDMECAIDTNDNVRYVLPKCQGKKLAPVLPKDRNSREFFGYAYVCNKEVVSNDKVYIRIDSFQNAEELEQRIANTDRYLKKRINEAEIISEFMLPFLKAMRTQPVEVESKSLLAMALFLHPNKTLRLLHDFLVGEDSSENDYEKLREFIYAYMKFLESLKIEAKMDYGYEFLFNFSDLFKALTEVYIGNWIKKIIEDKGEVFVSQVFCAACNRNREELKRRNGYFNRIKTRLGML